MHQKRKFGKIVLFKKKFRREKLQEKGVLNMHLPPPKYNAVEWEIEMNNNDDAESFPLYLLYPKEMNLL